LSTDRTAALRRERAEWLSFCDSLEPADWARDSAAPGWRVQDVVAHLGSISKAMFTPVALTLLTSKNIERSNDDLVDDRRAWGPERVLTEYRSWSARLARLAGVVLRTPVAGVRIPVGELGRFPVRMVLGNALLFDHHIHLRHDIAPALGRPVPGTDGDRLGLVLGWMFSVLSNQLSAARPAWLDRPVAIELHGAGGGTWLVGPSGLVTQLGAGTGDGAAARIAGSALEFPAWATTRVPWREQDVKLSGDEALATRFLDAMNVV
jgi:uncharacterized protein (TIGR03083 family)